MALEKLNREFTELVRHIMFNCSKIREPVDRVKLMQWMKKLREQDDTDLEASRIRNEYAHFLRITVANEPIYFCMPFKDGPPEHELPPLPEALANQMVEKCPDLPKTGPLQPVMCHRSTDGRAFLTVKRCPEGGVFCYMAVSPHPLENFGRN